MSRKTADQLILVANIAGAHGVRGAVRLRTFTGDPGSVGAYGPLFAADGERVFRLTVEREIKDGVVARIDDVDDRDVAQALRGTGLYLPRAALPEVEDEDEFYQADLIGLSARRADGSILGKIVAVHDFGGGEMLELALEEGASANNKSSKGKSSKGSGTIFVPFTREVVPEIDIAGGTLLIEPPDGVLPE